MLNKEQILQKDIIRKQSELYPNKRGRLFHIPNERNNKRQAFIARSIGIFPGVADLIYFSKKFNVATELKVPGNRYKVASVGAQVWWGEVWEKQGNVWRLCTTVEEAISCYQGDFKGYTLKEMKKILKRIKTQTIKIEQWQK